MEQLTEALNQVEQTELQQCEQVIERGLKTFVEVGNALLTIRDKKLYRSTHGTFENYCNDRWGIAIRTAYKYIEAAAVVQNIEMCPMGHKPQSERQVRPLVPLEPETQREAWQQAVDEHGDNVTAKKVQEVVDEWREVDQQIKQAKSEPMFTAETPEEILRKAKEIKQQQKDQADQKRREQKERVLNEIHQSETVEHAFIYHGSCLDFIPQLDNESIDCLLTDPPYGIDFQMAKYRSNGERILTEYDKLQDLRFSDTDEEFYYFYCYLDGDKKITKYVLFDLKKLCNTTEFLFDKVFEPELKNGVDGGSSFRPIRISTLHRLDCVLVDKSQGI